MQNIFENCVQGKEDFSQSYIPTDFHCKIILQIVAIMRVNPSHIVIHTPGGCGSKILTKIVAYFTGIMFYEVSAMKIDEFLADCLNIIKVGGKID